MSNTISPLKEYTINTINGQPLSANYPPFYALNIPEITPVITQEMELVTIIRQCPQPLNNFIARGYFNLLYPTFNSIDVNNNDIATVINAYYCNLIPFIEFITLHGSILCELDQNNRLNHYCCGFIAPTIAFIIYMFRKLQIPPNPIIITEEIKNNILYNAVKFFSLLAYNYKHYCWNDCKNKMAYYIHDVTTLNEQPDGSIMLFTISYLNTTVIGNPSACFIDTRHHFAAILSRNNPSLGNIVYILDAWGGEGFRPLWVRVVTETTFLQILSIFNDTTSPMNVINEIIEIYFIPPHQQNVNKPTFSERIMCGGFNIGIFDVENNDLYELFTVRRFTGVGTGQMEFGGRPRSEPVRTRHRVRGQVLTGRNITKKYKKNNIKKKLKNNIKKKLKNKTRKNSKNKKKIS